MSKARDIADVLVSPDFTGTVTADGLTLGDNEKAKFGTGGDLQIFHDGSNSFINEVGTGDLNIKTNGNAIRFKGAGDEALATFDDNGDITLYYDNSAKFSTTSTGVNVTGSVTADGLVSEGNLNFSGANTSAQYVKFGDPEDDDVGNILYYHGNNNMVFTANASERMRINSAGSVFVNTASSAGSYAAKLEVLGANGGGRPINTKVTVTSSANQISFSNPNGQVGSIYTSGSSTGYSTSSDYRLKTDVQPMTGATATFKQLKPVNFEWIADGTRVDGFLAHELGEVIPAAATGTHNGMMDEEYEVSPATGDVYTAAIAEVATESQVMEAVEAGSYVNLSGETIVETEERGVTTDLVETVVQRQDVDGVSTEVEVEVTTKVPTMETVITTEAVDEIIHSADVEQPETLEDGQAWREITPQVMATRSIPDMQGIDQSKIVPLLTATIQELIARIEALEA